MPTFRYKVRSPEGEVITGTLEVDSKEALVRQLRKQHMTLLAAQPISAKERVRYSAVTTTSKTRPRRASRKIRDEDLLIFTRELQSLVRSGIPIFNGLRSMTESAGTPSMKQTIQALVDDVEAGGRLSDAMGRQPHIFEELYVSSVIAGEAAGQLPEVLDHLTVLLEHRIETRSDIQAATRYPAIVLLALCVGFGVILKFVIPRFADFYSKFNAELPLPTRILIGLGNLVEQHGLLVLGVLILCIFLFRFYTNTRVGRFQWDGIKLKIPVFGPLSHKIALSSFATTLELLYRSGVPITEAFLIAAKVSSNEVVRRGVLEVREGVMAGEQMADVMKRNTVFPSLMVQMISTGEQTGNLDQMLRDLSKHYDRQVKYETKNLTTLIEPMLTILLGGMVLVFALGIFLPMWNMINIFR